MVTPSQIKRYAKEAREESQRATDPTVKARLHEIANELERVFNRLEEEALSRHRSLQR